LQDALSRFHQYREIFISTGIRDDFSLPRQHSLVHYHSLVRLFAAPNGLCTSIPESKHIRAVKEPWRRSSRNEALGQMLVTNQRLDQLAAARVDFSSRGMLQGTCLGSTLQALGRSSMIRLFSTNLNLAVAAACTAAEPSRTHEPESEDLQDGDENCHDKPTLDEDPNDEVVDDEEVLAEVKLAATIRKLLSSIPSLIYKAN
jgi:hypothetical protein